jgi:hypothetical protein
MSAHESRNVTKVRGVKLLPILACLAGLVAGCATSGHNNQDQPGARKFTWFSYVKGDDLRRTCVAGAPDRYRFVYNGVYVEQVRSYDIEPSPQPGLTRVTARVTEKANLATIVINPSNPDVFEPWRAKKAIIDLPQLEMDRLKRAVLSDGLSTKAAPRRAVTSIEFYWAVSACIDGKFHLNAWVWPNDDFNQASFPKMLFAWDMTGVAVNAPRKTTEFDIYGESTPSNGSEFVNHFRLRFDES